MKKTSLRLLVAPLILVLVLAGGAITAIALLNGGTPTYRQLELKQLEPLLKHEPVKDVPDTAATFRLSLKTGEYLNELIAGAGLTGPFAATEFTGGLAVTNNGKDIALTASYVNGSDKLVTANAWVDESAVTFQIPQITDKYVKVDLTEYNNAASAAEQPDFTDPELKSKLKDAGVKLLDTYFDLAGDVAPEETTIDVNGAAEKANLYTVSLDADALQALYEAGKSALNEVPELKEYFDSLIKTANVPENSSTIIGEPEFNKDLTVELKVYAQGYTVIAREIDFADKENTVSFRWAGSDTDGEIAVNISTNPSQIFTVKYSGVSVSETGLIAGTVTLDIPSITMTEVIVFSNDGDKTQTGTLSASYLGRSVLDMTIESTEVGVNDLPDISVKPGAGASYIDIENISDEDSMELVSGALAAELAILKAAEESSQPDLILALIAQLGDALLTSTMTGAF